MSKHKKIRFVIHYVKPTAQLLFKIRFPKGGPTCRTPNAARTISCKAWNSPAEYPSWVARCDITLLWRHNGCYGVSKHQPHDCLLSRSFRPRSKKTWKPRVNGLCAGNSPATGEFPAQMASNAENVSIWWRHHEGSVSTVLNPIFNWVTIEFSENFLIHAFTTSDRMDTEFMSS